MRSIANSLRVLSMADAEQAKLKDQFENTEKASTSKPNRRMRRVHASKTRKSAS